MRTGQTEYRERKKFVGIIIVHIYIEQRLHFKIGAQQQHLWRMKFCRRVRSPYFTCCLFIYLFRSFIRSLVYSIRSPSCFFKTLFLSITSSSTSAYLTATPHRHIHTHTYIQHGLRFSLGICICLSVCVFAVVLKERTINY